MVSSSSGRAPLGAGVLAAQDRVAQFAVDRRAEALQAVLGDVVLGAGLHGGHGDILAHDAGDEDEG